MLSDERIGELWVDIHKGKFMHAEFNTFARAVEAAVLPEGWVAVPKEPTLAMLGCLRSDITSNLEKRYQAMIAAAPQSAQAEPSSIDKAWSRFNTEIAQAEKQEPVKDDPVAWRFSKGTITKLDSCPHGGNWQPLYTRPQPDLTAEVERLREDSELLGNLLAVMHRDGGHHAFAVGNDQAMQDAMQVYYQHVQRIAELEEAARQARDTLQYKLHVVEAIAKLDWVLGGRI